MDRWYAYTSGIDGQGILMDKIKIIIGINTTIRISKELLVILFSFNIILGIHIHQSSKI